MQTITTTKQIRLEQRNERIRKRFNVLTARNHYSTNHTLTVLADEFIPLTEDTIWLIVSKTGYYKIGRASCRERV